MLACTGTGGTGSSSATVMVQTPQLVVLHDFGASSTDCSGPGSSLIEDPRGILYGTTDSGGLGWGCIYPVSLADGSYAGMPTRGAISGRPYAGLHRGTDGSYYGTTGTDGAYGNGMVFKISFDGTASTLHDFIHSEGCGATAGVIQGSDGYLYGTTTGCGQNNTGTVFKLTTSGAVVWVYSFPGPRYFGDFANPRGDLIEATDGYLYGTTSGTGTAGIVYRLSHSGIFTTLYSFGSSSKDGRNPEAGVIQGSDGFLYGTTEFGGLYDGGTVFKLSLSGQETVLHSFSFSSDDTDGYRPVAPLVQGTDGNFYGTTSEGGGGGGADARTLIPAGTIFRITPSGNETVLWSFFAYDYRSSPPVGPQDPIAGLIQGQNGSFYGTSYKGGKYGGGTIFKLTLP